MEKEKIRELRKSKGLTQEQLAKETGLTTVTINRVEKRGTTRFSTLKKITDYLNQNQNGNGTHN